MNNEHIIIECTKSGLDAEETKEVVKEVNGCTCESCEATIVSAIENNRKKWFTQEIPEEQINLIRTSIRHYLNALKTIDSDDTELSYKTFDLNQLNSMLLYQVTIKIDEKSKNTFSSKHGKDFPQYSGDYQLKEVPKEMNGIPSKDVIIKALIGRIESISDDEGIYTNPESGTGTICKIDTIKKAFNL